MTSPRYPIGTRLRLSGTLGDVYVVQSCRPSHHGWWYVCRLGEVGIGGDYEGYIEDGGVLEILDTVQS